MNGWIRSAAGLCGDHRGDDSVDSDRDLRSMAGFAPTRESSEEGWLSSDTPTCMGSQGDTGRTNCRI